MGTLTTRTPGDWKDLQEQVASVLAECGFEVEIEKEVATVRGTVEIDVYAREEIDRRVYSIACECKHWKAAVPQTVVHAFRTVLADMGTNSGYIVSSAGFQSGCHEASRNTNVKLLDWNEFQEEFKETWLQRHLFPFIAEKLDSFMTYTEPLVPNWFLKVPDDDVVILRALRAKYEALGVLAMMFTPYARFGGRSYPSLPLRTALNAKYFADQPIPDAVLDATGDRDLRDALLADGLAATAEFDEVRTRNGL